MKTNLLRALALIFIATLSLPLLAGPLGTAFTYQGRLNDGANPANGSYDLKFTINDAATGLAQIGSALTNAATPVSNGLFTVTLDFGSGLFTGAARWLEVAVRPGGSPVDFTPLTPRQPLTPAPYAFYAPNAGTAATANSASAVAANSVANAGLQAGAVTSDKIADGTISASDLSAALASSTFWRLGGNTGTTPGANYLGTADNQPFELKANGVRSFRIEPTLAWTPNIIAGHYENVVSSGVVGGVISGGGGGGGAANSVGADYSTIGGGVGNIIQNGPGWSTISGGVGNTVQANADETTIAGGAGNTISASSHSSTIGGGRLNKITNGAWFATVPGGLQNVAGGWGAFAAGQYAQALHPGTFVWSDYSSTSPFASTAYNQFLIRAVGGVGIGTNHPQSALHVAGIVTATSFNGNLAGNATTAGSFTGTLSGDVTGPQSGTFVAAVGGQSAANVAAGASAANAATSLNAGNAIVKRDSSGNFSAGTISAAGFSGSGAGLTSLNASGLASGTVPDARLAANLARTSQVWLLGGNAGTSASANFLGTTDNQPLELRANNQRGLRIEPNIYGLPNVVGGSAANVVAAGASGVVLGGGDRNTVQAAGNSVLAGGQQNSIGASASAAAIGGGVYNTNVGLSATIPGGYLNYTSGEFSFAAGCYARANHRGAFVWADSFFTPFSSSSSNQFLVRASGGVGINKNNPTTALDVSGTITATRVTTPTLDVSGTIIGAGLSLSGDARMNDRAIYFRSGSDTFHGLGWYGSGGFAGANPDGPVLFGCAGGALGTMCGGAAWSLTWNSSGNVAVRGTISQGSDRNAKTDFAAVEPREVLEKVAALPIQTWRYNSEIEAVRHLGPVAQDFHAAFGLGDSDTSITTVDEGGVALAAIQGLHQKLSDELKQKENEIAELKQSNQDLAERLEALERIVMNQRSN